jgi:DNA-binding IclR family transcriptional regulator
MNGTRGEQLANQRAAVLALLDANPTGLSMKEIAAQLGVQFNRISGRGTELKYQKLVATTGELRDGSAVLVATGKGK